MFEEVEVGAYSNPIKANSQIQTLCDDVRGELQEKVGEIFQLYKAIIYRQQVVAGMNYLVKIQVDTSNYVHVTIFKPLPMDSQPDPQLISFKLNMTKDDHLHPLN